MVISRKNFYEKVHKIVHFACERNFCVFQNHTYSKILEPFNISLRFRNHAFRTKIISFSTFSMGAKARNHTNSTVLGRKCTKRLIFI